MRKPCVLVVVAEREEWLLPVLAEWVRKHGVDVCACLDSRVPPLRCWSERFVAAILPSPDLIAGSRSPIDTWYSSQESSCAATMLPWLHACLRRGGWGVPLRSAFSTRPRLGCLRQVRGCGLDLVYQERDERSWDGARLAYPGRRSPDLRARA